MALRSGAEASTLTRIEEHDEDESVEEEDDISIIDVRTKPFNKFYDRKTIFIKS